MEHEGTKDTKDLCEGLSSRVLGAAIRVHRELGPGLLESSYEFCLFHELRSEKLPVARQVRVPLIYRGQRLDCGYRMDLLVAGLVVVEVKAIAAILPIHRAQMLTYLRLQHLWLGLVLNFNVEVLRVGINRVVNG
ncbi:MAG: GxxExxY protein [Gemmatimonadota bacterium]